MNKERWQYIKNLKAPAPLVAFNAGKGQFAKGTSYVKKVHGALLHCKLEKLKNGRLRNVYQP